MLPCAQPLPARPRGSRAPAHARREGEDARCFLVECAERFLRRHALEGYEPHLHAALAAVRGDAEAGRPDVPAADIVAAEIKRVRRLKKEARLPSACRVRVCSRHLMCSVWALCAEREAWPVVLTKAAHLLVRLCLVPLCLGGGHN